MERIGGGTVLWAEQTEKVVNGAKRRVRAAGQAFTASCAKESEWQERALKARESSAAVRGKTHANAGHAQRKKKKRRITKRCSANAYRSRRRRW